MIHRNQPEVWLKTNASRLESFDHHPWEATLFSQRSPDKSSDNEDAAACIPLDANGLVLAVADGCGGCRGGELAAKLTIETIVEAVTSQECTPFNTRGILLDAIDMANEQVLNLGIGSACTLAVVEIFDDRVRAYHVGDAQIVVSNHLGKVRYESTSHSPVGYAVAAGLLGSRQALQHQRRHVVSNVVGNEEMKVEIGPSLRVTKNDRILLSSDGLFDNLFMNEIVTRLSKGVDADTVAGLSKLATSRMLRPEGQTPCKPDDMTIIAARLHP